MSHHLSHKHPKTWFLWISVKIFGIHLAQNLWQPSFSVMISCNKLREICGKLRESSIVEFRFSRTTVSTFFDKFGSHYAGSSTSLFIVKVSSAIFKFYYPLMHSTFSDYVVPIHFTKLLISIGVQFFAVRNLITAGTSHSRHFQLMLTFQTVTVTQRSTAWTSH